MSIPKWILIGSVGLFSIIGIAAVFKKKDAQPSPADQLAQAPAETAVLSIPTPAKALSDKGGAKSRITTASEAPIARPIIVAKGDFPNIDRIFQLFTISSSQLPIVETITYTSTVPWLKGRPAWIADYATHYNTSRHFIARSMNGKPDYFSQKVSEGSRFNVFRNDKRIQFHLLVDVSRCKMGFYYVDLDTNERILLKTYSVGLGRLESGTLTPIGRFKLGNRVAIYKPGVNGYYQDQKVEMVQVFGTRWIPFEQEGSGSDSNATGYGLQGAPWMQDPTSGQWVENREVISAYDSDGCIRMHSEDIEELYAIVLTKPTFIEIVKDFHEAKLPGVEVAAPSR